MTEPGLRLVAVDLGAESGRAVVGTLRRRAHGPRGRPPLPQRPGHPGGHAPLGLPAPLRRRHWRACAGPRSGGPVASVGVDTWGVDFGLLDGRGRLLGEPGPLPGRRTDGGHARARLRDRAARGDLPGHGHPVHAHQHAVPAAVDGARGRSAAPPGGSPADDGRPVRTTSCAGSSVAEYTNASTSQCLDPFTRDWARPLLERFGIPTAHPAGDRPARHRPGPAATAEVAAEHRPRRRTRVVAPGSHDTASAVVGAPLAGPTTAFLSSGTWSLIGLEVPEPVVNDVTLAANLTNEGGVGGHHPPAAQRVWACGWSRSAGARSGPTATPLRTRTWPRCAEAAPAFTAFVDPDDERFLRPGDMPSRVRGVLRRDRPAGARGRRDAHPGASSRAWPCATPWRWTSSPRASGHPIDVGPRRGRRLQPPPAVPADGGRHGPPRARRSGRGDRDRQRRRPGDRRR